MAMRTKVDEDLPRATVQMLRDRGHEAVSVIEQGMGGKIPFYGRLYNLSNGFW
jgi:hypothetical protein